MVGMNPLFSIIVCPVTESELVVMWLTSCSVHVFDRRYVSCEASCLFIDFCEISIPQKWRYAEAMQRISRCCKKISNTVASLKANLRRLQPGLDGGSVASLSGRTSQGILLASMNPLRLSPASGPSSVSALRYDNYAKHGWVHEYLCS